MAALAFVFVRQSLDNAAYINHWLRVMKADNRAIFTSASHAIRAVDYLAGLQSAATEADA